MLDKFAGSDTVVLVVEDDQTTRELVVRLLTLMGAAEVLVAEEGGQGLRLACERQPDLVICDIEMEPVDGLAFLGGLRASLKPGVATIPVVLFTSTQQSETAQKAKELGVTGFMVKPFNPKGFATYVLGALEKKSFLVPTKAK